VAPPTYPTRFSLGPPDIDALLDRAANTYARRQISGDDSLLVELNRGA